MKRLSIALIGVLLAAGCSGSSSSSSPSTTGATQVRFTADLKPANEVPAITNAESTGSGTATIDFTVNRDTSGNVTGGIVNFQVTMSGFPSTAVVNIAHIHDGGAGVNGAVLVNTTTVAGEVVLSGGSGNFTRNGIAMTADITNRIIANPAAFYFNVHTTLNPGGVIRGQLVKVG